MKASIASVMAAGLFVLLSAGKVGAVSDPQGAQTLVQETTVEVFDAVRANRPRIDADPKAIYGIIDQFVLPHFDFNRMSRRVLGRYWASASEEQQERFKKEFQTLLVRTYATAIRDYTDQPIKYLPLRTSESGNEVTVRTEIEQKGGMKIGITYDMYTADNGWKVYDVTIEGVSLVINYRATFANEIRSGGIAGLIERLASHNAGYTD